MRICLIFCFSPVVWHHGVDSDRGDGLFYRSCSLLGHVYSHLVLGSDHFSVYYLPHRGSQEDAACPMEHSGKNTHICTYIYVLWDSSGPEPEPKPKTQFYPAQQNPPHQTLYICDLQTKFPHFSHIHHIFVRTFTGTIYSQHLTLTLILPTNP